MTKTPAAKKAERKRRRDELAVKVLLKLLPRAPRPINPEFTASLAYSIADAMIKQSD